MKHLRFLSPARLFTPAVLALALFAAAPAEAQVAKNAQRTRIAGIDLIVYPAGVKDIVTFEGSLPAGDRFAPETNLAIPTLVGGMLDQGTLKQDKFAIADQLDRVGATLNFGVSGTMLDISGKCLKKDLPLVIALLAEQLREPAFSAEELEKFKQRLIGNITRQQEDTSYRATQAFAQAIYNPGHPNYEPPSEAYIAAIQAATVADLKAFHQKYYGPAQFTLVAVGDVDAPALQQQLATAFTGWTGGVTVPPAPKAQPADAARDQTVFLADKTSVNIIIGQTTGLRYTDPDRLALSTATAVLGGSGFSGRLMQTVRDQEGLTYGIYSSVANDTFSDGDWKIVATFSPALLDKGIASAQRQLTRWYQDGITDTELAYRKDNLIGTFKVGLATTDGLASQLLTTVHRGLDLTWLDQYESKIAGLSLEQVNGSIKKYLKPEQLTLIKAGTVTGAAPATPAKP